MILNFSNLSVFTPNTLSLIITGENTVTKALSEVTISGNTLSYSPSDAEKTSLGSGILTVQVKIATSSGYFSSEILRFDANDLDNEILTFMTFSLDKSGKLIASIQGSSSATLNVGSGCQCMVVALGGGTAQYISALVFRGSGNVAVHTIGIGSSCSITGSGGTITIANNNAGNYLYVHAIPLSGSLPH